MGDQQKKMVATGDKRQAKGGTSNNGQKVEMSRPALMEIKPTETLETELFNSPESPHLPELRGLMPQINADQSQSQQQAILMSSGASQLTER